MGRGRIWLAVLLGAVGLIAGAGLGVWYGWEVDPVAYTDTDLAHLHPSYRDEYILMVSKAYALDGDLDTARARIEWLMPPDPASTVADLAEQAIAQSAPTAQIRVLAHLAQALGADRPALAPYLSPEDDS
jgi:hypothetical protein